MSPNGRSVAASRSRGVSAWTITGDDLAGGMLAEGLPCCLDRPVFSGDGRLLAGFGRGKLYLWDVASRRLAGEIEGKGLYSLAFDPTGSLLAGGASDRVLLWDTRLLEQVGEAFVVPKRPQDAMRLEQVTSVAFSPDGETLAVGGWGPLSISLFDVASREPLGAPLILPVQYLEDQWVSEIAFGPRGNLLASRYTTQEGDFTMLWDLETRRPLGEALESSSWKRLWGSDEGLAWSPIVFAPDGKSLIGTDDGSVVVRNLDPRSWQHLACEIVNRPLTPEEWSQYVGETFAYEDVCP